MLYMRNDGKHDFGYPCYMPEKVTIDGLHVDDSKHPSNYRGMVLFSDPGGTGPYPYVIGRKVVIRGLTTASGKKPRVSQNARIAEAVEVVWED